MKKAPTGIFSPFWGKVTYVRQHPKVPGDIVVRFASQLLHFEGDVDGKVVKYPDGLAELGMLRLSKKSEQIFAVIGQDPATGKHFLVAGWKNPTNVQARHLQAMLTSAEDHALTEIAAASPDWACWDDQEKQSS